jgi:hypothetical protein
MYFIEVWNGVSSRNARNNVLIKMLGWCVLFLGVLEEFQEG